MAALCRARSVRHRGWASFVGAVGAVLLVACGEDATTRDAADDLETETTSDVADIEDADGSDISQDSTGDATSDAADGIDTSDADTAAPDGIDTTDTADPDTDDTEDTEDTEDTGDTEDTDTDTVEIRCEAPDCCYDGPEGTLGVGVCEGGRPMADAAGQTLCVGAVKPVPHDVCNGYDDDCNGLVDDMAPRVCGLGACRVEVPACLDGEPNGCIPGTPTDEVCGNGVDDDCNGAIDDGCDCVYVSASRGGVSGELGSFAAPFRQIGPAITAAASGETPRSVCVEAGTYPETLTMRNGVHVRGGYDLSGSGPTRPGTMTRLSPATGAATVTFPDTLVTTTVLDGFEVRFPSQTDPHSVAVTISGRGATLIDNAVRGGRIGVLVQGQAGAPAQATLARNRIMGCDRTFGIFCDEAIGVRADEATLVISDHCDSFDEGGRCATGTSWLGIWGEFRDEATPAGRTSTNIGIELLNTSNTLIERTLALSHTFGTSAGAENRAMGIKVGDQTSILEPRSFDAEGLRITQSYVGHGRTSIGRVVGYSGGIDMRQCGAAVPLVDNNFRIFAGATNNASFAVQTRTCGAMLANNLEISTDEFGNTFQAAIVCGSLDDAEPCHILDNHLISTQWPAGTTTAIWCEGDCGRIEGNRHIVTNYVTSNRGVVETLGHSVIRRNLIEARCPSAAAGAIPVLLVQDQARIENNVIRFANCDQAPSPRPPIGHLVGMRIRGDRVMLLSNTVRIEPPAGSYEECRSSGLSIERTGTGTEPSLFAVNNLFGSSPCLARETVAIGELDGVPDLRFEHNNFATFAAGDALVSTPSGSITTLAALHASAEIDASGNISVDPGFVSADDDRLSEDSLCVDAGTAFMSPAIDFTGAPRPQGAGHDIGAYER